MYRTSQARPSGYAAEYKKSAMFTANNIALRSIFGTIGRVICVGVCLVVAITPANGPR